MGYASGQLDDDYGSKIIGAQFADCADANGKIALKNIKPIPGGNLTADDLINNISFQILNNWGGTVEGSDRFWDGSKWIDENNNDKSEETYDAGQGFCVYNVADPDEGSVTLQSSGQVITSDVVVPLDDDFGSVMVANSYPIEIKLSSLLPQTASEADMANNISFQKINNWGGTVDGSDRFWNGSKWVDEHNNDCSNETLAAGEGICVYNSVDPDDGLIALRFVAPTSTL